MALNMHLTGYFSHGSKSLLSVCLTRLQIPERDPFGSGRHQPIARYGNRVSR
jgi:hypothetical protein